MNQAIVNPAELRQFTENLRRFNQDMKGRIGSLQANFNALGETWQDQEHARFAEEFAVTVKAFKRFIEVSEEHVPFLLRKAQRAEEYLKQR
jgi:uncharacterized protein YukE